ncbi:hypothetical protein Bca4012_081816 [Brassica carinata]
MSEITSLSQEEVTLGEDSITREDAFSDNKLVLETCRKRKRSDEEEEEEEFVEEDNDGFKTPTRLENRIPEVIECPPAPRKGEMKYSTMHRDRGKEPVRYRTGTHFIYKKIIAAEVPNLFVKSYHSRIISFGVILKCISPILKNIKQTR